MLLFFISNTLREEIIFKLFLKIFFQYPVIINIFIIIVLYGFFLFLKYIYIKPLEIEDLKLYMDFYLFIFSLCVFFL